MRRVVRFSRRTPSCRSSARMCRLSLDACMPSTVAAMFDHLGKQIHVMQIVDIIHAGSAPKQLHSVTQSILSQKCKGYLHFGDYRKDYCRVMLLKSLS